MRKIIVAVAAVATGYGVSATTAAAQEKCFDKGTLSYVDCPQAPAPAPIPPAPVAPAAPVYDWTGPYIGAHAGWAWTDFDGSFVGLDYDDLDADGFLAGGQLGYLHQYDNNIVIGVEIDGSWVWADDSANNPNALAAATALGAPRSIDAELDWLASARLRLGYASGRFLPYLTGGVALAGWEASGAAGANSISVDETSFGGVAGGGVEYMINPNWVLGAEGLYYFFDDDGESLTPPSTIVGDEVGLDSVIVARARLSYKF